MDRSDPHISRFAAWFALLGGGLAWMARFLVIWIVAEFGCVSGVLDVGGLSTPAVVLTIISLPFLAVAVSAVYVGWSRQRAAAAADEPDSGGRFMAGTGAVASGIFVVIMIVEIIPALYFLDECRSFSQLVAI